ncbi:SMP-30/gluconolactonase/LRE family protein [Amycolatopsis dongchuanensis]|uniref:SMP-30/gluconolactonase/LRE family protein n=1 Tax=Amycolatopsis dongchuanensis TaxID=1070866 RepID=A0ABP8VJI6_9PSEU
MSREIQTVVDGLSFLECPRWHEGRIWFADFYTHRVYSATEDGGDLRVEAEVEGQPSGLGWLPDGRLLVVSMRDARLLRREPDGSLVTHADLSSHVKGYPNDMVVDARGRAFVGEFGFDLMGGAPLETAALLRADPDGTVTTVAEDVWFPNGSVLTDDGVLLVCETFGNRVSAFDVTDDGDLVNRRTWAKFGELPTDRNLEPLFAQVVVAPDGCCLDAEGALWVADATGNRVLRVREGGEVSEEISPGTGAFACMLGGEDGRTLFVCAAPDFHEDARTREREGTLRAVRVESPHAGRP